MSFFNFLLKGDDDDMTPAVPDRVEDPAPTPSAGAAESAPPVTLSKEEMREIRLGKIASTQSQAESPSNSSPSSSRKATSVAKTAEVASPRKGSSVLSIDTGAISATPAKSAVNTNDSRALSLTPPPIATKIASAADITVGSPNLTTPSRNARTLNSALEGVFLFTLRPEGAGPNSSGQHVVYVGEKESENGASAFLNSSNLTDYICSKLAAEESGNNTVSYLTACYKRIATREGTIHADVRQEFLSCKSQCVSFIVTALMNPEMFGYNSANSCSDLLQVLSDDASPAVAYLMKDVAAELSEQGSLTEVALDLTKRCYDLLNKSVDEALRNPQNMMRMMGQPPIHSCLENVSQPMTALCVLARSDKRIARAMVQAPSFHVDPALRKAAPQQNRMGGIFGFAAAAASSGSVQGAAVADKSLIGRLLRNVVDSRDPQFQQLFANVNRMSRSVVESNINMVRGRLSALVNGAHEIVKSMLVGGSPTKEEAVKWLMDAVALNAECEKDQPSTSIGASRGFMLNLSCVLLQLCRPFVLDEPKLKKVDWKFLVSDESKELLPRDSTPLMASEGSALTASSGTPANFMTQSFFMTVRALHLSYSPMCRDYERLMQHLNRQNAAIQAGEPRALQLFSMKLGQDCELLHPDTLTDMVNFYTALAFVLMNALREGQTADLPQSILHPEQLSQQQKAVLAAVPEYIVDDLMTCLIFTAKNRADLLSLPQMSSVLEFALFFLRRPSTVKSPHIRAKFGELLYQVFLPNKERDSAFGWNERYATQNYPDGIHSHMVESLLASQQHLAPTLLLLYGDVERTGFYEKISHRRRISSILKHLWGLPSHRPAFRGIALSQEAAPAPVAMGEEDSLVAGVSASAEGLPDQGASFFIRFANGLLNETNKLVSETLTSLGNIKEYQSRMQTAEFATMNEEQKKQFEEKLHEAEGTARHSAGLCLETVHMVNYLTTDEVIQKPFLQKEILPRFVSMIFNVIYNMSGAKGLEFKVDNMESYNFRPKDMLREVCEALLHVCSSPEFQEASVGDAFFKMGTPLSKAISVITKHSLMAPSDIAKLTVFKNQVADMALDAADLDKLLSDAPEEYLDPLLLTLMEDPVLLTTSNNIVDRATIMTQLLNDPIDPFNRAALSMADVKPCPELKAEIDAWVEGKKRGLREEMAKKADSARSEEKVTPAPAPASASASAPAVPTGSAEVEVDEEAEIAAAIALSLQNN